MPGFELVTVNTTEGAAYGAALLAAVGAGVFPDVPGACQSTIHLTGSTRPSDATRAYQDYYPRYQALYPALSAEFAALTETVNRQPVSGKVS